ncbi:yeats family protein [Ephemerocybe angulata]|uniref:Protein AF-9 homolog n=1 Tax=Ephemerocybe angulata TaxID=980116 RepID=A0A8H6IDU1_9AGAR|nr:yeats family protein [Tulosesus angulatus]
MTASEFEVLSIFRPIIYGNTAVALTQKERDALPSPDHTHRWTVAVGGADDLSYFIKRVTFKLHDTYPTPTRNIDKPPFELHPWTITGEPEIPPLEVALKAGPVHSWQYDEIVFNDPFQNFLNLLTQHPPTPLPKVKKKPVPFHLANPGSFEESKGGTPEFWTGMIAEEAERLEEARKKVITEQERLRAELIEKEQEYEKLKKQVAESAGAAA